MPRDTNGSYSLPPGTIVTVGSTIVPSQHNPAMEDLGNQITGSLSRDGLGAMRAPLDMGGFAIVNPAAITFPSITAGTGTFTSSSFTPRAEFGDGSYYAGLTSSTLPFLNFDANDFLSYARDLNEYRFNIGGISRFTISDNGASTSNFFASGALTVDGNASIGGNQAVTGTSTLAGPVNLAGLSNFSLYRVGSNPSISWDIFDFNYFDRSTDAYVWMIGNDFKMTLASNGTVTAGAFVPTSDRRIKTEIEDLDGVACLSALTEIGGKRYLKQGVREFGVIAQDVEAAGLGDIVHEANDILGVNYNGLIAVLIASVVHLDQRLRDLEGA